MLKDVLALLKSGAGGTLIVAAAILLDNFGFRVLPEVAFAGVVFVFSLVFALTLLQERRVRPKGIPDTTAWLDQNAEGQPFKLINRRDLAEAPQLVEGRFRERRATNSVPSVLALHFPVTPAVVRDAPLTLDADLATLFDVDPFAWVVFTDPRGAFVAAASVDRLSKLYESSRLLLMDMLLDGDTNAMKSPAWLCHETAHLGTDNQTVLSILDARACDSVILLDAANKPVSLCLRDRLVSKAIRSQV